jgi:ABC transport system ATP-binding/permease protein
MTFAYWLLLFSTSCFANVLGLNVSASFNSAKVIYIMIPVLIIPQLLFSGIIVKFDKLHPWFASEKSVPLVGNVMASRWAYEGLAVTQFMDNAYERGFYAFDQRMKTANWKKDLWVKELANRVTGLRNVLNGHGEGVDVERDAALLRNELQKEARRLKGLDSSVLDRIAPGTYTTQDLDAVQEILGQLTRHYRSIYKEAETRKEERIAEMTSTPEAKQAYFALLDGCRNESLTDIVTNKNDVNVIVEYHGELVQKSDPIYLEPHEGGFFDAHFYAPRKLLWGMSVSTLVGNTLMLWAMSLALALALYSEAFPRLGRALKRSSRQ